ncbi:MAG TPA: T9SS type A sorting domain-containing protein [Bacteroidales bacterium]|nr:T9SS type A sorting domain-containing protein [Bacteroidales bacterium]
MKANHLSSNIKMKVFIVLLVIQFFPFYLLSQFAKPPYPLIFVHGLIGSNTTWNEIVAELGGDAKIFDVCLNHDNGSLSSSILSNDIDVIGWRVKPAVPSSNRLYVINFDNSQFAEEGHEDHIKSNQSAIYKQGYALGKMIKEVLILEKSDKVILVGHSMGGLAIREYLQRTINGITNNPHSYWIDPNQTDGHDVAKVLTIGTPHSGANDLTLTIPLILDSKSEAVRDLRFELCDLSSCIDMLYLYGGYEGILGTGYHNNDINCDGLINSVSGINDPVNKFKDNSYMPLPTNIPYTWLTSNWGTVFDGVVMLNRQWLHDNEGSCPHGISDTLLMNAFHMNETKDVYSLLRGMDEPDLKQFAYELQINQPISQYISGFATFKSQNNHLDVDYYKFTSDITGTGRIDIREFNNINNWQIALYNSSNGTPFMLIDHSDFPDNTGYFTFSVQYGETYYMKIKGEALTDPHLHPYMIKVTTSSPAKISFSSVQFDKSAYLPSENVTVSITLNNQLTGANVSYSLDNKSPVTCSEIENGIYRATFTAPTATGPHNLMVNASKTGYQAATSYNASFQVANAGLSVLAYPSQIIFDGSNTSTITATLVNGLGQPMSGIPIQFYSTFGQLIPGNAVTNAQGVVKTLFTPDQTGTTTIQATAQTTNSPSGSTTIKVTSAGNGTYNITLNTFLLSTNASGSSYKLDPFVSFSSNGQAVEGVSCTVSTNFGQFQNGSQSFTQILGENDDPGTFLPAPVLNVNTSGIATITITAGPTTSTFSLSVFVGDIPKIQPFYTLVDASSTENMECEIDWNADGNEFAYTPGKIVGFPSFDIVYSGPNTGNPTSLSFSKTGQKLIMGRSNDNPVFYIYDNQTKVCTPYNPNNTRTNTVAWSDGTDDIRFALANSFSGSLNQIIINNGENFQKTYCYTDDATDLIQAMDWKGNYLAVVTEKGNTYLYNFNASPITRWKFSSERPFLYGISISPDKTKVAVLGRKYTGNNNLYIINAGTGALINKFSLGSDNGSFYSIDWSPDGKSLVCAGNTSGNGYLKIIDPSDNRILYDLVTGTTEDIRGVRWSSKNIIAAIYGSTVKFYAPFDLDGPQINIAYPPAGFQTSYDTVHLKGNIIDAVGLKSVIVKLNATEFQSIPIASDGSFNLVIPIVSGQNDILINTTDRLNNSSSASHTVVHYDPVADVDYYDIALSYNTGSSSRFTISSNTAWKLTENTSWFDINCTEGRNDQVITVISTLANKSSSISRTGEITLSGNGFSPKTVTVTQTTAPYINISGITDIYGTALTYTDGTSKSVTSDLNGDYSIIVPFEWGGTITPSKQGYTFSPVSRSYSNLNNNQSAQNFAANPITYTINGNTGLPGVSLSFYDGSHKTISSDASGNYTIRVSYNWNGNVIPFKEGYSFLPVNRSYINITSDYSAQNFSANPLVYSISGNAGTAGVILSYTDGISKSVISDENGNYSFTVSYNWNGIVTPTKNGYSFIPINAVYSNVIADQSGQNFSATAVTFKISGNTSASGVTMTYIDGVTKTAISDGIGNYTIIVPYKWSGTITPSKPGVIFTPATRSYTNIIADKFAQDYATDIVQYKISGNAGASGVTLNYTDGIPMSVVSDLNGDYSLNVSYGWSGTVTPLKDNYSFTPTSRSYQNITKDATAENFIVLFLEIMPVSQNVSSSAGIATFSINSNTEWKSTETSDWLSAAKTNPTTLTVNYNENISINNRSAIITLSGTGVNSQNVTVIQDGCACVSPTGLAATVTSQSVANFNWTNVNGAYFYEIRYKPSTSLNWTVQQTLVNNYYLTGLICGITYNWEVRSNCSDGVFSSWVPAKDFKFTACQCNSPNNLTVGASGQTTADLDWANITGASGYEVRYKEATSLSWITQSITASNYSISGLTCGLTYVWEVRSNCVDGNYSSWVSGQNFNTATCPCNSPTSLGVSVINQNSALLNWHSDVNSSLEYEVRYKSVNDLNWISRTTDSSQFLATGLTCGLSYDWEVRTICGNNNYSFWVAGLNFITKSCPCDISDNIPNPPAIAATTQPTCMEATGSITLGNLPETGTWTLTSDPGGRITEGNGSDITLYGFIQGQYKFTVTNVFGCTSLASGNVIINPQPETPASPVITQAINVLHSDKTTGNQWYNQSGLIDGATSQDYIPTYDGEYYVVVTLNGCSSFPSNKINIIITEVAYAGFGKKLILYPNPVNNKLIIEAIGNTEQIHYEIYTSMGQKLYEGSFIANTSINTDNLSAGIYIIKLDDCKIFEYRKFIKAN